MDRLSTHRVLLCSLAAKLGSVCEQQIGHVMLLRGARGAALIEENNCQSMIAQATAVC